MSALIMIQPLLRATTAAGSVKEITKIMPSKMSYIMLSKGKEDRMQTVLSN